MGADYNFGTHMEFAFEAGEQAPPVANTWYTMADLEGDLIVHWAAGVQDQTVAGPEDIEFRVTIDGIPVATPQAAAVDSTSYYLYLYGSVALTMNDAVTLLAIGIQNVSIPCRQFRLEMRQTSAVQAGARLRGAVGYSRRS